MKKEKEMLKSLSRNLIHRMVKRDSTGWPPNCAVFAYQPVRPHKKDSNCTNDANITKEKISKK